jgi:hypothetical protein
MDKTVLIEQTSKQLKRWELIVTAVLFLTLFAGLGLMYLALWLACVCWSLSAIAFVGFMGVRIAVWWWHG